MSAEIAAVTNEINKTLVSLAGRLLEGSVTKYLVDHQQVKDHLQRTRNQVGYFVTYRPSKQPIETAYVQPWLVDGAVSLSHLPPSLYNSYQKALEERIREGELFDFQRANLAPDVEKAIRDIEPVDLQKLIESDESILILAEAGSGKSALLAYLCFSRFSLKGARLPLFIDSQMLDKTSLSSVMSTLLDPLGLSLQQGRELGSGLALYLDGLDELPRAQYKKICAEVRQLAAQAPGLCITASCRNAAYHDELSFLRDITIYPFNLRRSEDFVRTWFKGSGAESLAPGLIHELRKSETLSELGRQPLMLSLMCNAFRRYLKVSRRLSALFDQCLDSLLWAWDADRDISRSRLVESIDLQKAIWLHSRIAVCFHENRERFVRHSEIMRILHKELPRYGIPSAKAELVLDEFCANSGILVKYTEDAYGFAHLALQEALTAKWFASETRWKDLIKVERISDSWWQEVIHLCAASLSDATDMLESIKNLDGVSEIALMKCIAECLKQDPPMAPDARNDFWKAILVWYHDGTMDQHDAACDMLTGIEDEWSVPIVASSLGGRIFNKRTALLMKHGPGRIKE